MITYTIDILMEKPTVVKTIFLRILLETYFYRQQRKVISIIAFIDILMGVLSRVRY